MFPILPEAIDISHVLNRGVHFHGYFMKNPNL